MPVILDPDSYDLWLDPGMSVVSAATDLLKPYDAQLMQCYPINTRINTWRTMTRSAHAEWRSQRLRIGSSFEETFSPMSDAGKSVRLDRELE